MHTVTVFEIFIIVFCCTAGFWHRFSMYPSLSVLVCSFECISFETLFSIYVKIIPETKI